MDDSRVGSLLGGRYRLLRTLGEGGMGTVYVGVQEPLGRKVAVKVLLPVLARDATLVARFQREAELAASLGHPNIVQVTDFGVDDGAAFLVMDLLEGESLGAVIEREAPLSSERVRFIATQILSALEAAHARGVVHRDLKPDNVFLTSVSGVADLVKLLDFGIARLVEDADQKMTATGQVLGTPAYMSPEQARGRPVDARSDLYAVGVVMYEALSGRMPVSGSNYHELMFAIVDQIPTSLIELVPGVDPELVAVIERAMNKEANARYASATEMRAAIDALGPLSARSPSRVPSVPPTTRAHVEAMAPTITPESLSAVVASDSARPAALEPLQGTLASPREASRSRWPILLSSIGGAALMGLVAFGLSRTETSDEDAVAETAIEAAAEARALAIVDRVMDETAARLSGAAPQPTTPGIEGAGVDRVGIEAPATEGVARERANEGEASEGALDDPAVMERATMEAPPREAPRERTPPRAPTSQRVRCGTMEQETPIVQPGDQVVVSMRRTNNLVPMDGFREVSYSWGAGLTRCYLGKPSVGGPFTLRVDAEGRVTEVTRNPFCEAPRGLDACVREVVLGAAVGNTTGSPGEMQFDISHRRPR